MVIPEVAATDFFLIGSEKRNTINIIDIYLEKGNFVQHTSYVNK
jgi:hypothetical protein